MTRRLVYSFAVLLLTAGGNCPLALAQDYSAKTQFSIPIGQDPETAFVIENFEGVIQKVPQDSGGIAFKGQIVE